MSDFIIQTRALCRRFGDRLAVDRIDLEVPAGAVFGFLGPNGAGKTTTIRMLLGLLKPTSGEAFLFGESMPRRRTLLLRRLGALVESPTPYPHLTGDENLRYACRMKGIPPSAIARSLDIVGLARDASRLVKTYSLGMKQRLGLAAALLGSPELVILDEPTNGLDPAGIQEMRHLLRDLPASHGITVFLSSHLLGEVEQIATHIGIIAAGRMQFQGPADLLRARQAGQLRIGVDRAEVAAQLLRANAWDASESSGEILIPSPAPEDAAAINRFLVERGFSVHSLRSEAPSLESLFLDITQEQPS